MEILRFVPLYRERVWGGRALAQALGRTLPADLVIGESWELVDRPEACSTIVGGPLDGLSLRQAISERSSDIMGPDYDPAKPFPILVKWLDCQERLSLQVHPPATMAPLLGGEPKTENWYIADCKPDASLLVGLKNGTTREQFQTALEANELEPLVHRMEVEPGDSMFVYSGRIHAIDAGNLILEIQQNSDTTYRVYDWGRVGLDGQPRQLHIEESLKSIDFGDYEPEIFKSSEGYRILADCPEFTLEKHSLDADAQLSFTSGEQARILSVVEGSLSLPDGEHLSKGENVILPYAGSFTFTATEATTALVTSNFS